MKRIALAGLAVLLAGCGETAVQPLAPTARLHEAPGHEHVTDGSNGVEWQRFTYELNDVRTVECLSEPIRISGTVENAFKIHEKNDGSLDVQHLQKGPNVTITGLYSGFVWEPTAGVENFIHHINPDGHYQMYQHAGVLRYNGDQDHPNLYLKHFVHFQVAANGEVSVERTTTDIFECQNKGSLN